MKKTGFTLAEVLITLAIIGVVATMTLPALMNNASEQQAKTGLKKAINTLTEIGKTNQAIDNYSYSDVVAMAQDKGSGEALGEQTLYSMLARRASIDWAVTDDCEQNTTPATLADTGVDTWFYLRDGSGIYFDADVVGGGNNGALQTDGLPLGYTVVVDINGRKAPNVLSNCRGIVAGALDAEEVPDDAPDDFVTSDCNNRTLRVIRDQFQVRLRGDNAVPEGAASRWAYEN